VRVYWQARPEAGKRQRSFDKLRMTTGERKDGALGQHALPTAEKEDR
jgi:hypothetical protein